MRRREFIAGLGGAAAWPLVARAQQPSPPTVGWLQAYNPEVSGHYLTDLSQRLGRHGLSSKAVTCPSSFVRVWVTMIDIPGTGGGARQSESVRHRSGSRKRGCRRQSCDFC